MTKIQANMEIDQATEFSVDASRVLKFRDNLCVYVDSQIRKEILKEAHISFAQFILIEPKYIRT